MLRNQVMPREIYLQIYLPGCIERRRKQFNQPIGIHYQANDSAIAMTHWAMIFTLVFDPTSSSVVALLNRRDDAITVYMTDRPSLTRELRYFVMAQCIGIFPNLRTILGSQYLTCFDNDQPFTATLFLLFQDFTLQTSDRFYSITYFKLMEKGTDILRRSGIQMHHPPNVLRQAIQYTPDPDTGATTVTPSMDARATVTIQIISTSTTPVSGSLAAMITPVPSSTAYTALASMAALLVASTGFTIGVRCLWLARVWEKKTMFDDPREYGFPLIGPPLTSAEQGLDAAMARGKKVTLFQYSYSMEVLAGKGYRSTNQELKTRSSRPLISRAQDDWFIPTEYVVGIRFQGIGEPDQTEGTTIATKHWVIVFTPILDPSSPRVIELLNRNDGTIALHTTDLNRRLQAHPLANYTGIISDTDAILRAHPMRGSLYSASFNNCQHFVATFLLLLQAFTLQCGDRSYSITNLELMEKVNSVLYYSGTQRYHAPNAFLQRAATATAVTAVLTGAMMGAFCIYERDAKPLRKHRHPWRFHDGRNPSLSSNERRERR